MIDALVSKQALDAIPATPVRPHRLDVAMGLRLPGSEAFKHKQQGIVGMHCTIQVALEAKSWYR